MPRQPNSHLLRRGRYSETGRAYLITAVVHQRHPLFRDFRLGRLLVAEFKRVHDSGQVNSLPSGKRAASLSAKCVICGQPLKRYGEFANGAALSLADAYVLDPATRDFMREHNPEALRDLTERLLEAQQRGLWQAPGDYREALEEQLLDGEEQA